ncbi:hypothetical protein S7335_1401 [Synechococcus sp. PCC 7335]|uniref:hypothetical protein n=1 Tax=Synechococcus sp. (strain ATCC 29403 / PCC 7335) TaxID=91464 RepID=UPI00017EDD08|nr:hypothetical protein [Synechococcus sp. PCC 7335]EDX83704.1 hypothetical protein S7335_1401 [Synechococcus sp. PCC 7335]
MAFHDKVRIAPHYRTTGLLAMGVLFILGSCTIGQTTAQEPTSPSPSHMTEDVTVDEATLITPTSIGEAKTCMSLEELQRDLSMMTATVVGQDDGLLADASGVVVLNAAGELAFYAPSYGDVQPDEKLLLFVTTNPDYQTAKGIGPGTLIEEAERAYGPASLSYHHEAESREFVTFENGPENIGFRTGSGDEAGVYSPQEGPYFQTQSYRGGATIQSVWVTDRSCLDDF